MDTRTKIMAATWENDTARKFQSDLTPVETISGKELAERLVARPQRFYCHRNLAFPSHIAICDGGRGKLKGEPIQPPRFLAKSPHFQNWCGTRPQTPALAQRLILQRFRGARPHSVLPHLAPSAFRLSLASPFVQPRPRLLCFICVCAVVFALFSFLRNSVISALFGNCN